MRPRSVHQALREERKLAASDKYKNGTAVKLIPPCWRTVCDGGPSSGLELSCSPSADITASSLGGCRCGWWGSRGRREVGGDGLLRVLARVRGWTHCRGGRRALLPQNSPPSTPLTPQGISRLFWRGPWGPFHHYTHDSLMQQALRRCMGKDGGVGSGGGVVRWSLPACNCFVARRLVSFCRNSTLFSSSVCAHVTSPTQSFNMERHCRMLPRELNRCRKWKKK